LILNTSIAEIIARLETETLRNHNWQFKIIIPKVTTTLAEQDTKETAHFHLPSFAQVAIKALQRVLKINTKHKASNYETIYIQPFYSFKNYQDGQVIMDYLWHQIDLLREFIGELSPASKKTRFGTQNIDVNRTTDNLSKKTLSGQSPTIVALNSSGKLTGVARHLPMPHKLLPTQLKNKLSGELTIHEEAYAVADDYQNNGIGPILAHVLKLYAQENGHNFDGLYYAIKRGNKRAVKIAEKAGYELMATYDDGEYINYLYLKPDAVAKNQSKLNKQYYSYVLDSQPFLRTGDEVIINNDLPAQADKSDLKYKLNVTNATINLLVQQLGYQTGETEPFNIENLIGNSYKKIQSIKINDLITKTTKIISKNEKNKIIINEDVGTSGYNITINYLNRDNVSTSANLWVGISVKYPKTPIVGFITEDVIQTYPTKKRRKK
jgi:GNAT superfamily N-acetyltransferase